VLIEVVNSRKHFGRRYRKVRPDHFAPFVKERLRPGARRVHRQCGLDASAQILPLRVVRLVVEVGRQGRHRSVQGLFLLGAHIARHELVHLVLRHRRFSLSDQRAEGRDIDGLAAVDAGQDGTQQTVRLIDLHAALLERFDLSDDHLTQVDRSTAAEFMNLAEREPGALHRHDAMKLFQLGGAKVAPSCGRAQRLHQATCFVKAQRACGETRQSGNFGDVE